MMNVKFKWFDKGEWRWLQCTIMAENIEQAQKYLRMEVNVDSAPYRNEDSLCLIGVEEVSIPCFILDPIGK